MLYETIESIRKHLQQKTGLTARHFPDEPEKYRLKTNNTELIVHYQGSGRTTPETGVEFLQTRTPTLVVTVVSKSLVSSDSKRIQGVYQTLDDIEGILQNFNTEMGTLYPGRDYLVSAGITKKHAFEFLCKDNIGE